MSLSMIFKGIENDFFLIFYYILSGFGSEVTVVVLFFCLRYRLAGWQHCLIAEYSAPF